MKIKCSGWYYEACTGLMAVDQFEKHLLGLTHSIILTLVLSSGRTHRARAEMRAKVSLYYSKTVLGCKENRRYEMGVLKIVFRGRRHPSSIDDFPATSHCSAIIMYLISPINRELKPIYQAEQSGPDQMLLPAPI